MNRVLFAEVDDPDDDVLRLVYEGYTKRKRSKGMAPVPYEEWKRSLAAIGKYAYIRKHPNEDKCTVYSEKGKEMDTYGSEKEAKHRLQQVEYFKHKGARDALFSCQECGRKFYNAEAAEMAMNNGCPGCGGSDVDTYVPDDVQHRIDGPPPTSTGLAQPEDFTREMASMKHFNAFVEEK